MEKSWQSFSDFTESGCWRGANQQMCPGKWEKAEMWYSRNEQQQDLAGGNCKNWCAFLQFFREGLLRIPFKNLLWHSFPYHHHLIIIIIIIIINSKSSHHWKYLSMVELKAILFFLNMAIPFWTFLEIYTNHCQWFGGAVPKEQFAWDSEGILLLGSLHGLYHPETARI